MLQELISHSLYCRQYIKYDCNMAPLELHSATWFISSSNDAVDFLGNVKRYVGVFRSFGVDDLIGFFRGGGD